MKLALTLSFILFLSSHPELFAQTPVSSITNKEWTAWDKRIEQLENNLARHSVAAQKNWDNAVKRNIEDLQKGTVTNPEELNALKRDLVSLYFKHLEERKSYHQLEDEKKKAKLEDDYTLARKFNDAMVDDYDNLMNAEKNFFNKLKLVEKYLSGRLQKTTKGDYECDSIIGIALIKTNQSTCVYEGYTEYLLRTKQSDVNINDTPFSNASYAFTKKVRASNDDSHGCPRLWDKEKYKKFNAECTHAICQMVVRIDGAIKKRTHEERSTYWSEFTQRNAIIRINYSEGKKTHWAYSLVPIGDPHISASGERANVQGSCSNLIGPFKTAVPSEIITFCKNSDNNAFNSARYYNCSNNLTTNNPNYQPESTGTQ